VSINSKLSTPGIRDENIILNKKLTYSPVIKGLEVNF